MRIPLSWLKEYVAFDLSPADLADRLTFSGMEVEAIESIGAARPGVIVGEIRAVVKHPNADKLTICKVFDGTGEVSVVCGAPNAAVGVKVPLAPIGVKLPNGMKIKATKIRGEPSAGMLCAEDELGISSDHTGLLILPPAAVPGTPVDAILPPPETVLVIEVTPNRPDCLSMIGMAREVAALLRTQVRMPEIALVEDARPVTDIATVEVADTVGCPRYTARAITGVTIAPSPSWMQARLAAAGVRPINNIVDITNYVMLECGQPLHAFDLALIEGRKIIVRRASPGESMATLDGQPRALLPTMLVIADTTKPVALAGVMGGAGSEIRATTRDVLLESACFNPTDIRRTAKQAVLMTESSYRYERGVDPMIADWASRRAAALMRDLGGGAVARGVIDRFPEPPRPRTIRLRYARAHACVGVEFSPELTRDILSGLELGVADDGAEACTVTVPTFRFDLQREIDLIEELARIHGLDKIPAPSPTARIIPNADNHMAEALMHLRSVLVGLGLREVMHYSLVSDRMLDAINPATAAARIKLLNPISADQTTLRDSLIPQVLAALGRNRARQVADAALFEIGRVFTRDSAAYREATHLCIGLMGQAGRPLPARNGVATDAEALQWLKGILEALCRACRVPCKTRGGLLVLELAVERQPVAGFEPDTAVGIAISGSACGAIGLVTKTLRAEWRMVDPVAMLEIDIAPLVAHIFDVPGMKPIPAYPAVERDLAIVVDDAILYRDVADAVMRVAPAELVDMRLFDIYRGQGIPAGRKSMAFAFTYRSPKQTLTDDDANALHQKIVDALAKELRAEIRR